MIARSAAVLAAAFVALAAADAPHFDVAKTDVLVDDVIPIAASGFPAGAPVTVTLRGGAGDEMTSSASFVADASGAIDLTRMAPAGGSYKDVDPMGLFWSVERKAGTPPEDPDNPPSPESWTLTAESAGAAPARVALRRRAIAEGVRVSPVRENGLVGVFYEPPGEGRHPAMLVLGGSGGGIPPAIGQAGGLASRGYASLALAYFNAPGLPRVLSNIPLEYFGTALQWLANRPSVDPQRIGVLGSSRGAELSLLLGSVYPAIRTVVAYMPSNVVNRGCCDVSTQVAWTTGGRPIAPVPSGGAMRGRGGPMASDRPEIPVERIRGAVLLISGKDDGVWDSAPMAGRIESRLKRSRFAFPVESLVYDHAGHAITRPYTSTMDLNGRRHPLTGRIVHLGGTAAGTAHARDDSWRKMLAFVEQHLRN